MTRDTCLPFFRFLLFLTAAFPASCRSETEPTKRLFCQDESTVASCLNDQCVHTTCREDELCRDGECVRWTEAELHLDFDLAYDEEYPRKVVVTVRPGGFPRRFTEAVRFTFGDGAVGLGERIAHVYDPGVYLVELTVDLEGYRRLEKSKLARIHDSNGDPPEPRIVLTVNEIPVHLNGSRPFESDNSTPDEPSDDYTEPFHLLLPTFGFDVNVQLLGSTGPEAPTDNTLDPSSLSLVTDVALGGGAVPAGTELLDRIVFRQDPTEDAVLGSFRVEREDAFPEGMFTLTLSCTETSGRQHVEHLTMEAVELTPELDPFDTPLTWLFRFDMDFYTEFEATDATGNVTLEIDPSPNGISDFTEELRLIGAQGDESASGADAVSNNGLVGANAVYRRWIIDEIVKEVYRFYEMAPDGAPRGDIAFTITTDDDPSAPDPSGFDAEGSFSIMRFGGSIADNILGMSGISLHNRVRTDNSSADRGVFTFNLIKISGYPIIREAFEAIDPHEGVPVGEHPLDEQVLSDSFDRYDRSNGSDANERYDLLIQVVRWLGLAVGTTAAHEMGHAMGLIPDGPPPSGFFGDRGDVTFIGDVQTNSHHVDLDEPPINMMQAGNTIDTITSLDRIHLASGSSLLYKVWQVLREVRFCHYSLSYLGRRLTYGSEPDPPLYPPLPLHLPLDETPPR